MKNIDPVAVAEDLQREPIDPSLVSAAHDRVGGHLQLETLQSASDTIEGCPDFARLIPAFVAGELPEARRLLVEEHTRACVPCRRVLMSARSRDVSPTPVPVAHAKGFRFAPLLAAASVVLAASGGLWFALRGAPMTGELARIQTLDGQVLLPSGASLERATAGNALTSSNVVRTGRDSRAVLRLADGSRVEMAERSEISLSGRRDGLTVRLNRGQVIVEAAKQASGKHLSVATADCDVTVVGTVFSVASGTRGSRVSVLEGEVKVASGSSTKALLPGDQTSTAPGAALVPIESEIAWSENQDRYLSIVRELASLKREIQRAIPASGVRHGTRLLDAAPAGTVVYAAIPNASGDLLTAYRLITARLDQGGVLAQHAGPALRSPETKAHIEEALSLLNELGEQLGDEIAVAVPRDGETFLGAVLYAEARRPRALADFLPGFVARVNAAAKKDVLRLGTDAPSSDGIVLSQEGDFLVLAIGNPALTAFRSGPFTGSPFHARLATAYRDGVYQILAADLATLVGSSAPAEGTKHDVLERLGVLDAESFIVTRSVTGDSETSRAELGFGRERRGVASWLAAPAAMASLDFISPNASLAAAVVVKDPSALVGELYEIFRAGSPDFDTKLENVERELGIDIRKDLAASLGGEIAIAVDGPVLPKPAVEVIVEVYDPARLQNVLSQLVSKADAALRKEGKPGLALGTKAVSGRTFHTLSLEGADPWLYWTYENGFLVAASDRVLVERALQTRSSGATLRTSEAFLSRLPGNGPLDVSAVVWQNLGSVLRTGTPPSLGYAWGEKDRVVFAATSEAGLLGEGLPALMSLAKSAQRR